MAREVKSSRLFKNDLMEAMTHVHPITPLLMWIPTLAVIAYYFPQWKSLSSLAIVLLAIGGLITWTLTEYLLHRFVFHFEAKSKIGKRIVFLFHGIHHDEPDDATRLVMPPLPTVILGSLLFGLIFLFVGKQGIVPFFTFFIIGYLCYDYIHYGTHHFACKGKIMKYLKRHHMLHHHLKQEGKFGVSSPLWDFIFRTYGPKAF